MVKRSFLSATVKPNPGGVGFIKKSVKTCGVDLKRNDDVTLEFTAWSTE